MATKGDKKENRYFRRRARRLNLTSLLSVSLVIFMIGLLGWLLIHSQELTKHIKENLEVNVFIKESAGKDDIARLEKQVNSALFVKEFNYVSKEDAAEIMMKQNGETKGKSFIDFLGYNPLRRSYTMTLKADYTQADSLKIIENYFQGEESVEDVSYDPLVFDAVNSNLSKLGRWMSLICLIFLFISMVLINNSIKLALHAKRFSIRSMQLVGATRGFIQSPFLGRSILNGFIAGIIACAFLAGIIYWIGTEYEKVGQLQNWDLTVFLMIALVILGVLIAFISTFFSVRRHLNSNIDELYL